MSQSIVLDWFKKHPVGWYNSEIVCGDLCLKYNISDISIKYAMSTLASWGSLTRIKDTSVRNGFLYRLSDDEIGKIKQV
jgi:hypothetical protein